MAGLQITYICLDDRLFHAIGAKLVIRDYTSAVGATCFQGIAICDDER
jgi:hypothetical protein